MKKTTIIIFLLSTLIIGCSDEHPSLDRGLFANLQTNKGDIILQLEMEKTPVTVANFVSLAEGKNEKVAEEFSGKRYYCLLYTSPSPRDRQKARMPSSA